MAHPVDSKYRRKRDCIFLALKGFAMGMADVIPGISGGTIAFLLGIYEDLIEAIKSVNVHFLRCVCTLQIKKALATVAWRFLAFLLFGIAGAVIILSKLFSWLLTHHSVLVYAFFFGLICATAPIIARIIKSWNMPKVSLAMISAICAYWLVGLVPVSTPQTPWFIFLCGAIAISAMILPGISGAFILVLLGKYQFILNAVNHRDVFNLGVFILGLGVGIITFVRILSWLFRKYHDATLAIITGIVIGSLRKIWPWKEITDTIVTSSGKIIPIVEKNIFPQPFTAEAWLAIGLMAAGYYMAMILNASSDGKILSD